MDINEKLNIAWEARKRLYDKGDKLLVEGYKMRSEGSKPKVKCDKLYAEGLKLHNEGDILWAEAILEVHGNIIMEWKGNECHLETGEVFKP